jgi:hypothetical protein
MKEVKFLVAQFVNTEMTILCQDGGISFIENNDERYVSSYHSFRLPQNSNNDILDNLIGTDRKMQYKDWSIKREEIGLDMILDAVYWLYCSTEDYLPVLTYCDKSIDIFNWLETNYAE